VTWREELRVVEIGGRTFVGASFRGVPFFVESVERSGGRRAVVHEFPLRNDPYVEDMGRRARTFRMDGYVIGDDYLTQKDTLLSALEDEAGPGQLVVPYYGTFVAICTQLTAGERRAEAGMATFSLEFAEAPAQSPTPAEIVDTVGIVSTSADAAMVAVAAELVEDYDIEDLPAFALESAQDAIERALEGVGTALSPITATTQELAQLTTRITLLTARASTLVRTPADAVIDFHETITGLVDTIRASPSKVMEALIDAYSVFLGDPVLAGTLTRERELANQDAMQSTLRRILAIEAARLAPVVSYASIDEATSARDRIAAMLDEQAGLAGDTAYASIVDLRSKVLRAVPGNAVFARVLTVTRKVSVPSILLTYQLYGSTELEADIIARNKIRHPGFIAGDVKVLSDGE
jgi:prophage DNA circulation protein